MQSGDTIVAISSAVAGTCARIIVRMSGSDAVKLARMLFDTDEHQELPSASRRRLRFRDIPAFPAWVYHFKAPRSITGEDIVELHLPGNALLAKLALDELIHCGARQADPGEFTARGFFNGRLNLAEAEGIAAIVSANSQQQLDAARKLLAGELARRLSPIMDALAHTLALIEAGIDFTEEDISFINETQFNARVKGITSNLEKLLTDSERFERLQHQPTVVLAGRPNAGKSTLLNALAGFDRAVVSPVAGTTRDALGATVHLPRGLIRVIDVAGIDSSVDDVNEIETQMRSSAHRAIEQADVVVLVHDIADTRAPLELSRDPLLVAVTKCDLRDDSASMVHYACPRQIVISAKTRCGLSELLQQLDDLCFAQPTGTQSDSLALTVRHVGAIESAMRSLTGATRSFPAGAEIVAVDLRDALDSLGSILGQVSPDDVLGKIFSSFCIGK